MENFKLNVGAAGSKGTKRFNKPMTKERILEWINSIGYDEQTRDALIMRLNKYPVGAYSNFVKEIDKHVGAAQRELMERNRKNHENQEEANRQL